MDQPTTVFVGLDVHKDSISVARVRAQRKRNKRDCEKPPDLESVCLHHSCLPSQYDFRS